MKEFLKEAAENIENEDSLEENPMNKFNLKYSIYAILLLLLTVFLWWCIKDAIVYTSDLAQKIKNSTGKKYQLKFFRWLNTHWIWTNCLIIFQLCIANNHPSDWVLCSQNTQNYCLQMAFIYGKFINKNIK